MTTYQLKIVPDSDCNADGVWMEWTAETKPTYDTVPQPGWHIVQIKETRHYPEDSLTPWINHASAAL